MHFEIVQTATKIVWRYRIKDIWMKNRNFDGESIIKTENQRKKFGSSTSQKGILTCNHKHCKLLQVYRKTPLLRYIIYVTVAFVKRYQTN